MEETITARFVVPGPTDPGAPKRKMQMMKMARIMGRIQKVLANPQEGSEDQYDALDSALMEQYKYYATFIQGCTPEQALEYVMNCSEVQIKEMEDALAAMNDPKGNQLPPPSAENSDAP